MLRPPSALVLMIFAALGAARAGHPDALHPTFTLVPVILGGWFINATVLNDLSDEAIDRVNLASARGRPLVSGAATRRGLWIFGMSAAGVALSTAWLLDWRVAAVVLAGIGLNVAYSWPPVRLSARGAVASVVLPFGYVWVPYLVGAFSIRSELPASDLLLLLALHIMFVGRIVLKDFRDVHGDHLHGKKTFLLHHGRNATCMLAAACWIAGSTLLVVVTPLPFMLSTVVAAFAGCAIHALVHLAHETDQTAEQVIIGAQAHAGRGLALLLLAHYAMLDKGWGTSAQVLVTLGFAMVFIGLYGATMSERERVEAIRAY